MLSTATMLAVTTIDAANVRLIVTLVLPVLVALVTKEVASNGLKAVLLIVLSAVNELITKSIVDGGSAIISWATFRDWVLMTAIAIASYLGFYSPVVQINKRLAPKFGLGPKQVATAA